MVFGWGFVLVLSFIGWGGALAKLLRQRQVDAGTKAALGVAAAVAFGGVLNIFHAIVPTGIYAFIVLGLILFLGFLVWDGKKSVLAVTQGFGLLRKDKLFAFALLAVFSLFLIKYCQSVSPTHYSYNGQDDFQGYFALVGKTAQTGNFGIDPFSERRVVNSLGGQIFLDIFVLFPFSWNNLALIDQGVGLIIFLLVLIGWLKESTISRRVGAWLVFTCLLVGASTVNITSVVLAMAIILSLIRVLFFWENHSGYSEIGRTISIGLLAFVIITLKSSLIPFTVILVTAYYFNLARQSSNSGKVIKQAAIAGALALVLLLPFMFSMLASSGTLLYPILGKGFHGSAYPGYLNGYQDLNPTTILTLGFQLINYLFFVLAFGLFYSFTSRPPKARHNRLKLILGVTVAAVAIASFSTGGYGVYRYTFAFLFSAIIAVLIELLKHGDSYTSIFPEIKMKTFAYVLVGILMGAALGEFFGRVKFTITAVADSLHNTPSVSAEELQVTKALQESVPAGAILGERLEKPFLLNFNRNQVYIFDYPGSASLPPGMPAFKGPEALSDYLVSHSVRYFAYAYANQSAFPKEEMAIRLAPTMNAWIRSEAKFTVDFQDNMFELGKTRKRIYDDGKIFVLDLATKQ